jgi:uncharacterized membrane protein YkoI
MFACLLLSVAAFGGSVHAAAPTATPATALLRLAGGGISLDQAVQMAQARYNARVVRAETTREGDRVYYRLRLLSSDGRVFSVRVDAQTGSFQ